MSMNLADIETAIIARLDADATLTTLVQDVYNSVVDPDAELGFGKKPYVVLIVTDWSHEDAFQDNICRANFEVHHIDARENGLVPLGNVMDRTYGDTRAQNFGTPTYGLHRYGISVSGDNTPGTIMCQGVRRQDTDEALVYVAEYAVYLTEGAP